MFTRRRFVLGIPAVLGGRFLLGCGQEAEVSAPLVQPSPAPLERWFMPSEEGPHERTWMCWPSSEDIWAETLGEVQNTIADIALAIAAFEPVAMLVRPQERKTAADLLGPDVELVDAPVDDLWARDTLPNFLVHRNADRRTQLAAGHATFNGWGSKQRHDGDTQLAGLLCDHLGIELFESGLTGEGGAVEIDGVGTVLAAVSSWVNPNRNPGKDKTQIEAAILTMLGADRLIWVDGLAGRDITDGHIDTLARFAGEGTIVVDKPAYDDADDPWVATAKRTKKLVDEARDGQGKPYKIVEIVQPKNPRGEGDEFLATYMNYYVCNGAVIAPQFGDRKADSAAKKVLAGLFPAREIVTLDIDPIAAGGGGIHCATQQQPKSTKG